MRRKDREVTDNERIAEIARQCDVCRIALSDIPAPYIVPLNFGFETDSGKFVFYFHGAREGRKIDLIRKNGYAAFEADTKGELRGGDIACGYTYMYASIMGTGKIELVENRGEKKRALDCIMRRYTKKSGWEYDENALESVAVIKLTAEEISAKEH